MTEEERRRRKLQSENDKRNNKKLLTRKKQPVAAEKVRVKVVKMKVQEAGGSNDQQMMAAAIAMPAAHMRKIPDATAPSTALMRTTMTYPYRAVNRVEVSNDMPFLGTGAIVLTGQPGLSHVYWDSLFNSPNKKRAGYTMYFDSTGPVIDKWVLYSSLRADYAVDYEKPIQDNYDTDYQLVIVEGTRTAPMVAMSSFANGDFTPGSSAPELAATAFRNFHGPYMPLGVDDETTWFFMNAGDVFLYKTFCKYVVGSFVVTPDANLSVSISSCVRMWDGLDEPSIVYVSNNSPVHPITSSGEFERTYVHHYVCKTAGFFQLQISRVVVHIASFIADSVAINVQNVRVMARTYLNTLPVTDEAGARALWDCDSLAGWPSAANPPVGANLPDYSGWALVSSDLFRTNRDGDPTIGQQVRTSGVSVLVTNTSPTLETGGVFSAARVKHLLFTDITYKALTQGQGFLNDMPEAKGIYTFLLPEMSRLEFFDTVPYLNDAVFSTRFMLKPLYKDFTHVILIPPTTNPYAVSAADNEVHATLYSNPFNITVDEVFEFETNSRRYRTAPSFDPPGLLHATIVHFKGPKDWFYENPSHAAAIYAWLKAFRSKVKQYYPVLQTIGGAIDPRLGAAMSIGRTLI